MSQCPTILRVVHHGSHEARKVPETDGEIVPLANGGSHTRESGLSVEAVSPAYWRM